MHQAKTQKDRADDFFTISFFPPPLYYSTLTFHLLHLISASYVCFLVSFFSYFVLLARKREGHGNWKWTTKKMVRGKGKESTLVRRRNISVTITTLRDQDGMSFQEREGR